MWRERKGVGEGGGTEEENKNMEVTFFVKRGGNFLFLFLAY